MAIPECRGEDYQDLVFLDDLGVGSRASARGVPGQKRKRAFHRKSGNRQNTSGLRLDFFRLCPKPKRSLLYGHGSGYPAGGVPRRKEASAPAQTAAETLSPSW
jgi:hypothetical protein